MRIYASFLNISLLLSAKNFLTALTALFEL